MVLVRGDAARAGRADGRRAGGHRQQGQALPRARRPHLDDGRGLPRRAGDGLGARRRREALPRHLEPGPACTCSSAAPARAAPSSPRCKDTETVSSWGRAALGSATLPAGHADRGPDAAAATPAPPTAPGPTGRLPTRSREGDAGRQRARALPAGEGRCSPARRRRARRCWTPLPPRTCSGTCARRCSPSPSIPPGEVFQKPLSLTGRDRDPGPRAGPRCPDARRRRRASRASHAAAGHRPTAASCTRRASRRSRGRRTTPTATRSPTTSTTGRVGRRPASGSCARALTEPVLAWDTTTVPNGRYVDPGGGQRRAVATRRRWP